MSVRLVKQQVQLYSVVLRVALLLAGKWMGVSIGKCEEQTVFM